MHRSLDERPTRFPHFRGPGRIACTLVAVALCSVAVRAQHTARPAPPHASATREKKSVHFAVIGDFGIAGADELAVSNLVHGLDPDFVITVGDNNYSSGSATTIDANIGQYYHDFIEPYVGTYGAGAARNRFFPSLGNHDWVATDAAPYLAYFALPNNERYYHFVEGPVHFFAIDSDAHEPDGVSVTSLQATWLRDALQSSTSPFNVVYFHHPPYSSGQHGPEAIMHWPFRAWGADLVLNGHDHTYERIMRDGFPYVVNGLGGAARYAFGDLMAGSQARYNTGFGALWVEARADQMTLRFVTVNGSVADTLTLIPDGVDYAEDDLVPAGSTWKYLDDGSDAGTAWRGSAFDDSGWAAGPAQLGYGDGDEATVVSYGPNALAKYITTYFRKSFNLPDPTLYRALRIELARDDGAVVYLNGAEVYRNNLPPGAIATGTPALISINDADEGAFYPVDVPAAMFTVGTNVLAVEMHQVNGTSSDISFDMRVVGTRVGTRLSPAQATWKYLDDGSNPGAAWNTPAFDDSAWSAGPAQLGYGDGDEATVVSYGPNAANKYITTYFRRSFAVSNANLVHGLVLRLLRDDGAAVYLNGTEVFRMNVPFAGLGPLSTAEVNLGGSDETTFVETLIDPRLLVEGTNWLAVEMHQSSASSADLSFDLELLAQ